MKRRTDRASMVRLIALTLGVVALQHLAGLGPLQHLAGRWGPAPPALPLMPFRANSMGSLTPRFRMP
jgi:hypothetical protein